MTEKKQAPPVLVGLDEVAGLVGGRTDRDSWFDQAGFRKAIVADWAGNASLPVEVAAQAVSGYRMHREDVESKAAAYEKYLDEKRVEQAEALRAAIASEREKVAKMNEASRIVATKQHSAKVDAGAARKVAASATARGVAFVGGLPEPIKAPVVAIVSPEEFHKGHR